MRGFVLCGIRFDHYPPGKRSAFDFTEGQLSAATKMLRKRTSSLSAMVIATCDRIEVWCEQPRTSIVESALRCLGLSPLAWASEVYEKKQEECIPHLFQLASGLLSPLFGEDQILAQLQRSLERSRLCGCSSPMLETLARYAITSAKQVHTEVALQVPDASVALHVSQLLKAKFAEVQQCRILVIGASALARLVAEYLHKQGFCVCMTFRDLDKADLLLPKDVKAIPYDRRFDLGDTFDAVISASKGLGYTLTKEQAGSTSFFLDLAEVRDLDPEIAQLPGVELLYISDLDIPLPQRQAAQVKAGEILEKGIARYLEYEKFRLEVEGVQNLSVQVANDLVYRLNAPLTRLGLAPEYELALRHDLHDTARKVVAHHLYEQKRTESRTVHLDLSRIMAEGQALYPEDPPTVLHKQVQKTYQITKLECCSHAFTHMDSPAHVFASRKTLDQYPVSRFFTTAYVMDSSTFASIGTEALEALPRNCNAILFSSGKELEWGEASYLADPALLTADAIGFLQDRGVSLFGFDGPSCDSHESLELENHHLILEGDGLILENLCNLRPLVGKVVSLSALPLSFRESDGAPTRVVATYTP